VSSESDSKVSQSPDAIRQRRSRVRRLFENSGNAFLYVACRECDAPIKPSFQRGFCPGGHCRKQFFKKIQVPTVIALTFADQSLSEAVLRG
jgi:hypothetical protein